MTDLTDKWKKGELPSGWYYVRLIRGEYRIDLYINSKNEWIDCPDNIIDTVVCEVPNYEEWQRILHYAGKYEHEYTSCAMDYENLKQENAELEARLKKTQELELELRKENAKLKSEYEKECHRADELEDSYWKSEKENKQLKEEVSRESYKVSEAYCFVDELKELLKRCYSFIDWCELGVPVAQRPILMKDINQALGGDK